jgi:hypothetical protein
MTEETSHRVIAWLRVHVPATATAVRPPPGDAALAVAQEATGRSRPVDLVAWYRLSQHADVREGPSVEAADEPPFGTAAGPATGAREGVRDRGKQRANTHRAPGARR